MFSQRYCKQNPGLPSKIWCLPQWHRNFGQDKFMWWTKSAPTPLMVRTSYVPAALYWGMHSTDTMIEVSGFVLIKNIGLLGFRNKLLLNNSPMNSKKMNELYTGCSNSIWAKLNTYYAIKNALLSHKNCICTFMRCGHLTFVTWIWLKITFLSSTDSLLNDGRISLEIPSFCSEISFFKTSK